MLTFEEAKKIGKKACVTKLGKEFYEKYRTNAVSAYGDFSDEGIAFCYVGVSDDDEPIKHTGPLILSKPRKKNAIPYSVSCTVRFTDGQIKYLECHLPKNIHK